MNSELVAERGLAAILVGTKGVSLLRDPLLLDTVICTVDRHKTIVAFVEVESTLEHDLWFREIGGRKNDVR